MLIRQFHQKLQEILGTNCENASISVAEVEELLPMTTTDVDLLLDQLIALGFVERKGQHIRLTETGRLANFNDCN